MSKDANEVAPAGGPAIKRAASGGGGAAGVPEGFLCPITQSVMADPVSDADGNSYERAAISDWLTRSKVSPLTNQPLAAADLRPNRALRDLIDAWHTERKLPLPSAAIAKAADAGKDAKSAAASAQPKPLLSADVYSAGGGDAKDAKDASAEVLVTIRSPTTVPGSAAAEVDAKSAAAAAGTGERVPTDICCVIDVSGSMGLEAKIKVAASEGGGDKAGADESGGFSTLDLVKHAVKTIIHALGDNDRLAVVSYSSMANVVFDLTPMNAAGKAKAEGLMEKLEPDGQTNIWDGIFHGLEVIRKGNMQQKGGKAPARFTSNTALFVLTDGQPNVQPPRGYLPTLAKYKTDNGGTLPAVIHTFGFGYNLDSQLLSDFAVASNGGYGFIPDGGFVGTIFVNALSNVLTTIARNASVAIEGAGDSFPLTSVLLGQDRSILIPSGAAGDAKSVQLTVTYDSNVGAIGGRVINRSEAAIQPIASAASGNANAAAAVIAADANGSSAIASSVDCQRARISVVRTILQSIVAMDSDKKNHNEVKENIAKLSATVKAMIAAEQKRGGKAAAAAEGETPLEFLKALETDISGQITIAFSRVDWYKTWGKHYLLSLARAHALQQCNNFKDASVQLYGGAAFRSMRDRIENLFNKIPPPKPSIQPAESFAASFQAAGYGGGGAAAAGAVRGGGAGRGGAAAAAAKPKKAKPVSMASYNNRSNPCFDGRCDVRMADGTTKAVAAIRAGDRIASSIADKSAVRTVECVVQTKFDASDPVHLAITESGLRVTPYHPIRFDSSNGKWCQPASIAPVFEFTAAEVPAVYSFLLAPKSADDATTATATAACDDLLVISGVECVALGHNFNSTADSVVSHPYFGDRTAVVNNLSRMNGWANGFVSLNAKSAVRRDAATGLVTALTQ